MDRLPFQSGKHRLDFIHNRLTAWNDDVVNVCRHFLSISRFDMSCAQGHWVGSKPIRGVMQLKLHKPTMAIGYSLRMCARHVDSTNSGRTLYLGIGLYR